MAKSYCNVQCLQVFKPKSSRPCASHIAVKSPTETPPAYARTMIRLWQSVSKRSQALLCLSMGHRMHLPYGHVAAVKHAGKGILHLQSCHLGLQGCLLCLRNTRCASVQLASLEVTYTVQGHYLGASESKPIRCSANTQHAQHGSITAA